MPALVGKEKVYEFRVRRFAARLGFSLLKSHKRICVGNHGKYLLLHTRRNLVMLGSEYDASLADIEAFLKTEEARLRA